MTIDAFKAAAGGIRGLEPKIVRGDRLLFRRERCILGSDVSWHRRAFVRWRHAGRREIASALEAR